ncbi:MAG: metallophosphoesterase [Patescibacteria group bacterium]|nr:metallophosphoesterase [Patescibacteria group bacterium]
MKFPKQVFLFLVLAQALLTACHILLYFALIFLFPALAAHRASMLAVLLILSGSFLTVSIFDFKFDGPIWRQLYILSAVWAVAWFYLLLAAAASLAVLIVWPRANPASVALAPFIIAAGILIYGLINARLIRVVNLSPSLPNLPDFWRGKTAVMASDIHLGHVLGSKSAAKIVKKIQSLQPDLVLIPGDFFDGEHSNFASLAAPFRKLTAAQGIYFCSGNHEMFAGMQECEQAIRNAGITILENQKIDIKGLQIAGLAYTSGQTDNAVNELLKSLQLNPDQPCVLLKHVPAQIAEAAQNGVSLMLSGHSHQGQIWPGSLITKKVWKGFDYGLRQFGRLQVYTSSGVGTWGPPMRIFTKSEIIKITFK